MRQGALRILLLCYCFGMLTSAAAAEQVEKPRHGGTLEVGTVYVTINALSWDQHDWPWKFNHDAGQMYESLIAADLDKSIGRGGKYPFTSFAFLPTDALRGELAESWEWETPMRLVIKLRKGVMFPEKPGVMASRELVADDVIFAQNRMATSPKRTSDLYDFIDKTTVRDKHTLVYELKEYVADWDLRLGYGFTAAIQPKEVVNAGANNWRNANGTGPFRLVDYLPGNLQSYERNPIYWGKETIQKTEHKLPFVDKVNFRILKDPSTQVTALRTGKLDILETISWENVETLKKSTPQLKWSSLIGSPFVLALRMDTKPFDDVRVRRALNYAVDKQAIVKEFFGGNAEMFSYPFHPDWAGYYQPLAAMPDDIQELFKYDVAKAKKMLAEAGYPDGFTFKVQACSCSTVGMELLSLLAGYYEQIKVKLDVQVMEYAAHLSMMNNNTNAPGYLHTVGMANPFTTTRVNFVSNKYNPSQFNDPTFSDKFDAASAERDEAKRHAMFHEMARVGLRAVPGVFLPAPRNFIAWWPWVKNYNGELRAGATKPGPIYARLWIDQELKKKMGY